MRRGKVVLKTRSSLGGAPLHGEGGGAQGWQSEMHGALPSGAVRDLKRVREVVGMNAGRGGAIRVAAHCSPGARMGREGREGRGGRGGAGGGAGFTRGFAHGRWLQVS